MEKEAKNVAGRVLIWRAAAGAAEGAKSGEAPKSGRRAGSKRRSGLIIIKTCFKRALSRARQASSLSLSLPAYSLEHRIRAELAENSAQRADRKLRRRLVCGPAKLSDRVWRRARLASVFFCALVRPLGAFALSFAFSLSLSLSLAFASSSARAHSRSFARAGARAPNSGLNPARMKLNSPALARLFHSPGGHLRQEAIVWLAGWLAGWLASLAAQPKTGQPASEEKAHSKARYSPEVYCAV